MWACLRSSWQLGLQSRPGKPSFDVGGEVLAVPEVELARAARLAPKDAQIQIAVGRSYAELGLPEKAEAAFDEAVGAQPSQVSSWLARGEFYATRGQHGKATADFAAARERAPEVSLLHYRLALARLLAGDLAGYRSACAGTLERF